MVGPPVVPARWAPAPAASRPFAGDVSGSGNAWAPSNPVATGARLQVRPGARTLGKMQAASPGMRFEVRAIRAREGRVTKNWLVAAKRS